MWANAQRDGRPAEYRWRPLLSDADYSSAVHNAVNIEERKTWMQSAFCTWQNSVTGQEPPKMYIYTVSQQKTSRYNIAHNFAKC